MNNSPVTLQIRKAQERGFGDHGWLKTCHTFSFGEFYDPNQMGFRCLRVMNEDRVNPGQGFASHPHRDMEIITYVLEGQLEHKDNTGGGSVLHAGQFQHMTAGTGIIHSEFNPSSTRQVHFYQVWILPMEMGLQPCYGQLTTQEEEKHNRLQLVASPNGDRDSLVVRQDVRLYLGTLEPGVTVSHRFDLDRHGWLQVIRGGVQTNGLTLNVSDGLAVSDERLLEITATETAEVMLFDLP